MVRRDGEDRAAAGLPDLGWRGGADQPAASVPLLPGGATHLALRTLRARAQGGAPSGRAHAWAWDQTSSSPSSSDAENAALWTHHPLRTGPGRWSRGTDAPKKQQSPAASSANRHLRPPPSPPPPLPSPSLPPLCSGAPRLCSPSPEFNLH